MDNTYVKSLKKFSKAVNKFVDSEIEKQNLLLETNNSLKKIQRGMHNTAIKFKGLNVENSLKELKIASNNLITYWYYKKSHCESSDIDYEFKAHNLDEAIVILNKRYQDQWSRDNLAVIKNNKIIKVN